MIGFRSENSAELELMFGLVEFELIEPRKIGYTCSRLRGCFANVTYSIHMQTVESDKETLLKQRRINHRQSGQEVFLIIESLVMIDR